MKRRENRIGDGAEVVGVRVDAGLGGEKGRVCPGGWVVEMLLVFGVVE